MSEGSIHGWAMCPKAGAALLVCALLGAFAGGIIAGAIVGIVLGVLIHYGTCRY
jgi:hypothetical protein